MPDRLAVLEAVWGYLKQHPEEVVRILRSAAGLRLTIPFAALRWLVAASSSGRAASDLELQAVPPGMALLGSMELMNNRVRFGAVAFVERVDFSATALRLEIRLADVSLELLEEAPDSPLATLLKSGALDLSKPGNLARHMPRRPPILVEAHDDRLVLDLLKLPGLGDQARLRKLLELVTAWVEITSIETDWEHLELVFRMRPGGAGRILSLVRSRL